MQKNLLSLFCLKSSEKYREQNIGFQITIEIEWNKKK